MYTIPVCPIAVDRCRIYLIFSARWILLLMMLIPDLNARSLDEWSEENNTDQIDKVYTTLNGIEEQVHQKDPQVYLEDNYPIVLSDDSKIVENIGITGDYLPIETTEFLNQQQTENTLIFVTPSHTNDFFPIQTQEVNPVTKISNIDANVQKLTSTSISELENLTVTTKSYPETETNSSTIINYTQKLRRYDGAQVWRIVVENERERRLAEELHTKFDGQLWKEVHQEMDYMLKPQFLAKAEEHIRNVNLSRIILIENLQKIIESENPSPNKILQLQNRNGHRLTWQAYHRLADIHDFMHYMAKAHPNICNIEIIGYSLEKRPLKVLKISNGNLNNTAVWIDGGMHAREWISPAVVTYIANKFIENWHGLPFYIRNVNWYFYPIANPDGYEYSHTTDRLWRKNTRSHGRICPGVDLNRNFGYMWGGKGTSANPCSQTYRGVKAFSEPETFYISKFITSFPKRTFSAYLSFHSYGQYILYPWGYDYHSTNDMNDLDLLARQMGTIITKNSGVKYMVGSSANTLYPAAGGSDDWAKGFADIKYTYTIEMGDTGRYGFILPAAYIEPNGRDGYTVVETLSRHLATTSLNN